MRRRDFIGGLLLTGMAGRTQAQKVADAYDWPSYQNTFEMSLYTSC
jgi:hypothetical protein